MKLKLTVRTFDTRIGVRRKPQPRQAPTVIDRQVELQGQRTVPLLEKGLGEGVAYKVVPIVVSAAHSAKE